jgi:hypothetical protein
VRVVRSRRTEALAVACLLAACGSPSKDAGRGSLGKATAAAVLGALDAAAAASEPWRCARLDDPAAARLAVEVKAAAPRIAFVADARAAGGAPALEGVRKALDAAPVDVVVALGGMGGTQAEILAALGPIAQGAPWLTVAMPADLESLPEHRAAVAELAAGGSRVVDGSQVRLLDLGAAVLATLPGMPAAERLRDDVDGCVHEDEDVTAILRELAAAAPGGKAGKKRPTLLAARRTPRGRTDRAPGGVHAGDVAFTRLLAADPVSVVVHGSVDDATSGAGTAKPAPPLALAVGALDATPRFRAGGQRVLPSFLVVTVGPGQVAWRPVAPTVVP